MDGDGDHSMWVGLSYPPLEDYAFNFDASFTHDDMIDDLLEVIDEDMVARSVKEDEALDKMVVACVANPPTPPSRYIHEKLVASNKSAENREKPIIRTRPRGKGKEIKILGQVLEVETHNKTFYGFHPKNQPAVDNKIKEVVRDFRLEGREKVNDRCNYPPPRRHGNHGKGKEFNTAIQELNFCEAEIKAFIGETKVVEKIDKKRKFKDHDNTTMTTDYDLKFEASRKKLHEEYERCRDAKRQKQIQVIDVQKLSKVQPRCNGKSKGKPSLRQELMATGTCKSNKKFPSWCCNQALVL